ncbi:MAG: hypothetical protein K2H80_00410, partial [Ureaplasma sp.]|nr:hypothetical protein [Ureaplasma sp.]
LLTLSIPIALISASCGSQRTSEQTTLSNEKINYLNKNSLSLNFKFTGNYNNLKNQIDQLVIDSSSSSADTFDFSKLAIWTQELFSAPKAQLIVDEMKMSQSGTGWVFDYSLDSINNLVNYYIATNAHVTNTELKYTLHSSLASSWLDNDSRFSIKIGFPVNNENVSHYQSYISQPYASEPVSVFDSQYWLSTSNQTQSTILEPLPIGQLDSNNQISVESSKQIYFYYEITKFNDKNTYYLYVTKDANNKYKVIPSWDANLTDQWLNESPLADDFQIMKLSYKLNSDDNANITKISNPKLLKIQENVRSLLDYNTDINKVNETSSYIARLNYLINMETNNLKYDKKWFLFNDFANLNSDDLIYFGG